MADLIPPSFNQEIGWGKSELRRNAELLVAIVYRNFKGKYRRASLGAFWAVIQPLFYMTIFMIVRSILNLSSEGVPYAVFSYCALVPWTFFSSGVSACGPSIQSNAAVMRKVRVWRIIFPVSGVCSALIDFCLAFVILIGMIFWYDLPITLAWFWLPVLVGLTFLLALGVGLWVAAMGAYRGDIILFVPLALQLGMFVGPIMYPVSKVPEKFLFLFQLNPTVGIIEGFRAVMIKGIQPDLGLLGFTALVTFVIWCISWPVFRRRSQYFADVF